MPRDWPVGVGGRSAGGCVVVAVVRRRWPRDLIEIPISPPRYLSQDDRIEIANGLARGEPVKAIAARIGKTFRAATLRSPQQQALMARTSPGMQTARPTSGADAPSRAGSASMQSWPLYQLSPSIVLIAAFRAESRIQ